MFTNICILPLRETGATLGDLSCRRFESIPRRRMMKEAPCCTKVDSRFAPPWPQALFSPRQGERRNAEVCQDPYIIHLNIAL